MRSYASASELQRLSTPRATKVLPTTSRHRLSLDGKESHLDWPRRNLRNTEILIPVWCVCVDVAASEASKTLRKVRNINGPHVRASANRCGTTAGVSSNTIRKTVHRNANTFNSISNQYRALGARLVCRMKCLELCDVLFSSA